MRSARIALGFIAAACIAACGYTTRSLVPDRYRTIAVPVFGNETRRHDLEFELTRTVIEEVQGRTHLRVVPDAAGADLVLRGILREVDEETLSRRGYQRLREGAVFVTAEVEVTDQRTGAPVVKERRVVERESYVPALDEDVRSSRAETTRVLAERIVRTLESSW